MAAQVLGEQDIMRQYQGMRFNRTAEQLGLMFQASAKERAAAILRQNAALARIELEAWLQRNVTSGVGPYKRREYYMLGDQRRVIVGDGLRLFDAWKRAESRLRELERL